MLGCCVGDAAMIIGCVSYDSELVKGFGCYRTKISITRQGLDIGCEGVFYTLTKMNQGEFVSISDLCPDAVVIDEASTVPDNILDLVKEKKETPEDIKKRARKPPKDGPCKGCGKNLPLNRLQLCYRCWVLKQLKDQGWREGQSHPAGCGCDLDCRLDKEGADN